MNDHPTTVRCHFYVRTPAGDGQFHYSPISIGGPGGDVYRHTPHPPLVGDLVFLWDSDKKSGGMYRVLERSWLHSSYGSTDWPYGQPAPRVGPLLDIVVEAADGLFRDEAESPEDDKS